MRWACLMAYLSLEAQTSTEEYFGREREKKQVWERGKKSSGLAHDPGGGGVILRAWVEPSRKDFLEFLFLLSSGYLCYLQTRFKTSPQIHFRCE